MRESKRRISLSGDVPRRTPHSGTPNGVPGEDLCRWGVCGKPGCAVSGVGRGTAVAGLTDGVFHGVAFKGQEYRSCSDIDGDGEDGLLDSVIITSPIMQGKICSESEP
jgi:hypothetical protein